MSPFETQAQELLAEMQSTNEEFENTSKKIAADVDAAFFATDAALIDLAEEIEKGEEEEEPTESTEN